MISRDVLSTIEFGEGQTIEFKESSSASKLDKEIVAFANASGGTIYCGVTDTGEVVGTSVSNTVKSQIQDLARNCDPPIAIKIEVLDKTILKIDVPESDRKPHQCSTGFYLRVGANSQKLRAAEIKLLLDSGQSGFDSRVNHHARFPKDFDETAFSHYCQLTHISPARNHVDLLHNMQIIATDKKDAILFTNAGVLLFTKQPRMHLPESYLTAVCYSGIDKFSVLDRKDFTGNIIDQIESGLVFAQKHVDVEYEIAGAGARIERYRFPLVAVREALINALVHRDYTFQNSCVYLNIYSDRLEIENPGGIPGGRSPDDIEGRSIRRNPVLADLLFRAGYGEKLGSGLIRIKDALHENENPAYQIAASNFFSIRMRPRIPRTKNLNFSSLQMDILNLLKSSSRELSSSEIAKQLNTSSTTITRHLKGLIGDKLVSVSGTGKSIRYRM
jgi:ATP-dependent DNA helicase RecG